MKQQIRKKPLSPLLILTMVLVLSVTLISSAIGGGSDPTITVGSTASAVAPGDTVSIPVSIANNPGIATLGFEFDYDTSDLTLDSVTTSTYGLPNGLCASGAFTGNPAGAKATWFQNENLTADGPLFYLNFTVKSSATTGDYTVTPSLIDSQPTQMVNSDAQAVAADFEAGTIRVEAASSDTTIGLADFVGGVYTISEGGDYQLAADAAGTIEISTTDAVTITGNGMSGTANNGLTLDCTVSGADLTIEDLRISAPVTNKNVIDFTGSGNVLTLSGASLLENNGTSTYYAAIHVPHDGSLTIDGDGTLYVYKSALGAAIGGDCDTGTQVGETNGDITIAGGTIFAKGSMTGATIGAGQKGNGGKVYITGGVVNLMTKARGAVIGGGGEQGSAHGAGGNVYISGGTLLLYTDWSGSLIGCGNANAVYADGGNVYISGGSLKTVITSNACGPWGISPAANTVSDAAITAAKMNNVTDKETVYRLVFDTSDLAESADNFTVKVDGEDFYAGPGHEWQVGTPDATVNGGAFAVDTTETNLYLYVTGEDHTLTVNGETFNYTWNPETSTFTLAEAPPANDIWDGTLDTSWYDAGNPLTAYTFTTPEQLAGLASLVNDGNSFAGVTFTLSNNITLNSESSTANWTPIGTASVTTGSNREAVVNSGTPFAGTFDGAGHAVNGLYISSAANMQGLFGYLTGTVKNLTVNGSVISTAAAAGEYETLCVGTVAAFNHGGTIANVTNNATVDAPNMYFVGGIAGYNLDGTITRSANLADVTGSQCVGGIAGRNGGTITYSYNAGKVDGLNTASKNGVGGIAGKNGNHYTAVETGIIDSCYNTGTVGRPGQKWVGGIAGFQNSRSSTRNCYASGTIVVGAGRYAAIIGQEEGTSSNNYSLDTISSDTNQTVIGTKLTDAQLKTAASSLGGAFVNDTTGGGYPVLFWQRNLAMGTITVAGGIEGGVVEAPASAIEGNTVTVTVTPDEGYSLVADSLTYTATGQTPVAISVTESVYSFIMPAANVTINAAFTVTGSPWSGAGTQANPYKITDGAGLKALADYTNAGNTTRGVYWELQNDIDLSTVCSASLGSWTPIGELTITPSFTVEGHAFLGTFKGNGHKIQNLYISANANGLGLFGMIGGTDTPGEAGYGTVTNFKLYGSITNTNTTNSATDWTGAVCGKLNAGGTISYVINYAAVNARCTTNVGGIAGFAGTPVMVQSSENYARYTSNPSGYNTYILYCGNEAQIWGYYKLGGIVGENAATVMYCYNTGYILPHMHGSGGGWGGIAGRNGNNNTATEESIIAFCYNTGKITNDGMNDDENELIKGYAGIAGKTYGAHGRNAIYHCYNIGEIPVGRNSYGSITDNFEYARPDEVIYNNYSLDTPRINNDGTQLWRTGIVISEAAFKDQTYTDNSILALLGHNFVADTGNINNGFPVLRWQTGIPEPDLTSISIITEPTKTVYNATEVFNPAGMKVKALYSDGSIEILSGGFTYPTDPLTGGTTSVTISYNGMEVSQPITVNTLALTSIAITTVPTKTYYANGESFEKTGMVVKATFNDTVVQTLDANDYTVTPDPLTMETTAVTISYEYQGVAKTTTQPITVIAALPELSDEYYQIEDASDLLWFADQVSVQGNGSINGKLVNNLDLTGVNWAVPIGTSAKKFSGTFDGNGKNITGLVKKPVPSSYYGLFGYGYNATIKDLTVTVDLESASLYTAGLVGYAEGCTIDHVTINGSIKRISNTYTGGLTGYSAGSTFTDCVNNARIEVSGNYAAGIAGYANGASVFTDCLNNGDITSSASYVGGIVGDAAGTASFTSCRNTGVVTGSYHVGGIAGRYGSTGTILKCANSGVVTSTSTSTSTGFTLGGIAGTMTAAATIDQCYNTGAVSGGNSSIGGVVGSMTNASASLTNSYNTGTVTYTGSFATANIGGAVGYASNAAVTVRNCYNAGIVTAENTTSEYISGVIGSAAGLANVSNNYYLNTTAARATGLTASTDANAQAKTASAMRTASFVTALGNFYQLGPIYPALNWEKVVVTDEDVTVNDGSPVEIGSEEDTTNIILGQALVEEMAEAANVSLQLTTSNGEFAFDNAATGAILAAAGSNDILFSAAQLTESEDPVVQALIDDDALVFDFSLTAGGNPIFTEGSSSGTVSIRIPYELGSKDADKIKVYLISGGVKTPVSATYANGYITLTAEHFSVYSVEYEGLNIWTELDGANTHFNSNDQVTVKVYAGSNLEGAAYDSYQADVDFDSTQLTFNSSASSTDAGTSYMNLSSPGKVQIGYSSSESIPQNLSGGGTLLATLVFDVQPVATDGSTGSIGMSNVGFEVPDGSMGQGVGIGADLGYTLHNIRLTFQAGTGTTLTTAYAYVKYHAAGLYTDATYTTSMNCPVPVAASGYRLAADSESSPLWKDISGTGYTSADIAAGTFAASATFTAQASRSGHSSGSGGNTSNTTEEEVEEDAEEDIEEDIPEDDGSPVKNFTDIQENDWYYEAIKFVTDKGLFTGTSSTTFAPQTTMSRDMLVTALYRLDGEPAVGSVTGSFSDVTTGSWYANAVAWATANEIITGYDHNKFGPKDAVTREQMLAILYRYSSFKGYDTNASGDLTGFNDSGKIKDYALIPFKWGAGKGLIGGKGAGILDPDGDATRAEVATILMRFMDLMQ
ncbi:S-layer homology domain-containing protein [Candidatus Formimonas warabiya]|uniref:SLH domain-containing protein n=1 Tax=Formimonas warabiya TaxID=1761012 RepID=A0A3G1KRZ4_FORW1|nr:S-layer homology domain-containing protein [Candidatus Formimonas warabiya]ATW24905.1 hypothetical protein DCMF_09090 [Candidatus Formimonas warabiya]